MAKVTMVKLSDKTQVTPMGGTAMYVKVNSRVDEYEGKKKYSLNIIFKDKGKEAAFKKVCDDFLIKAKGLADFEGKQWRKGNDRCGYTENEDGTLSFRFQTQAFYTDKETGEEKQRFIPVLNAATKKKLANDVMIGNGSEVRVSFTPTAYWMTKESNGVNLYLNKMVVDKLIEYGGNDDFSDFGIEVASEANEFSDMDEDCPI